MCRVTMGHLRVTIGHLRATMGHLRLAIGYLKATVVLIRVTLGHLKVTIGYFFSISKYKANTTELHPKVRQTCISILSFLQHKKCGLDIRISIRAADDDHGFINFRLPNLVPTKHK